MIFVSNDFSRKGAKQKIKFNTITTKNEKADLLKCPVI